MRFVRAVVPGLLAAVVLVAITPVSVANAREKQTYAQGMAQCTAWCDVHNRTDASRRKCYSRCDTYWVHNGSDGPSLQIDGM
jgi:hypothetical protein